MTTQRKPRGPSVDQETFIAAWEGQARNNGTVQAVAEQLKMSYNAVLTRAKTYREQFHIALSEMPRAPRTKRVKRDLDKAAIDAILASKTD